MSGLTNQQWRTMAGDCDGSAVLWAPGVERAVAHSPTNFWQLPIVGQTYACRLAWS
jgi:hypothetical protein